MNRPGNSPVAGTMDMGDIVAGAWGLYTRRLGYWLALAALAGIGAFVFSLMTAAANVPADATSDDLVDAGGLLGGALLVVIVADLVSQVAIIAGAAASSRGESLTAGAAYRLAARRFLPGLAVTLITALVSGLFAATIILVPLALFFFVRWSQALPVLVVEGQGVLGSLKRSKEIVTGQWWRTFGIGLAILLLSFLPGFIFGAVFGAAGIDLLAAVGAGVASLVAAPFRSIAVTLLYLDLRARKGERSLSAPVRGVS